jgi:hypothetical protein
MWRCVHGTGVLFSLNAFQRCRQYNPKAISRSNDQRSDSGSGINAVIASAQIDYLGQIWMGPGAVQRFVVGW